MRISRKSIRFDAPGEVLLYRKELPSMISPSLPTAFVNHTIGRQVKSQTPHGSLPPLPFELLITKSTAAIMMTVPFAPYDDQRI